MADTKGSALPVVTPTAGDRVVGVDDPTVTPFSKTYLAEDLNPNIPITDEEAADGVTIVDIAYDPGHVLRYFAAVDDSTDDIAAVTTAINSTAGTDWPVFIPAGTMRVSTALQIKSGTQILGAGMDVSIIKLTETADEDVNVIEGATKDGTDVNWRIADLTVDGNFGRGTVSGIGGERPGSSGIATMGASFGTIARVRSKDCVLHGVDVCNGGEITSGGQRKYVDPDNADGDPTYYPDNPSLHVKLYDVHTENNGDDGITGHYSQFVWAYNPVCTDASHRHTTVGASNGFEIDDGCRDWWVQNGYSARCTRGFAAKTHPPHPSSRGIYFVNCVAELCNQGFYIHKSGTSTLGEDVFLVNPTVRNPDDQVVVTNHPIIGINVQNAVNVYIINPRIHAPAGSPLPLEQAILASTSAGQVFIKDGHLENWPEGNNSETTHAGIYITSSVLEAYINGTVIEECGYKGIVCTHSSSGKLRIRNIDCKTSTSGGEAVKVVGPLSNLDIEVSEITGDGYDFVTSYGSVDSTFGQDVKRSIAQQINGEDVFETLTGTVDASLYLVQSRIDSSGGAVDADLLDGLFPGHRKVFTMSEASNPSTLTVTNHETSSPEILTFAQVGDYLSLEWSGAVWGTIKNIGVAT